MTRLDWWVLFLSTMLRSTCIRLPNRIVHASGAVLCNVVEANITCSGSGELGQDHVYGAGSFTMYIYATIESGITSIGDGAFRGCLELRHVSIPEGIISIGSNAFLGASIATIHLPASLESIDPTAFNNCKFHKEITLAGGTKFKSLKGMLLDYNETCLVIVPCALFEGGHLTLPLVEDVNASALRYSKAVRVTIPEGVKRVRNSAFYHSSVEQIDIPSTTTTFHNDAVSGCAKLAEINLSTNNTQFYYEGGVFGRLKKFSKVSQKNRIIWIKNGTTSIDVGQYIEEIGTTTLQDCLTLTTITCNISNTIFCVDSSGQILLSYEEYEGVVVKKTVGCVGGATSIVFDNDIKWIGRESFRGLQNLQTLTLSANVVRADAEAFRNCPKLETVDMKNCKTLNSNGENVLPRYFFNTATSLTTVTHWPLGPFVIDDYCFTSCNIEVLNLPSHVTYLGIQAFASCPVLREITIPKSVSVVGSQAFYECYNLTVVNFESVSSVDTLESMAFAYCTSLSIITLPDSITSLMASCFSQDTSLMNITFYTNTGKYRSDCVAVYCPDSSYDNLWHTLVVCPSGVHSFRLRSTTAVIETQSFYGCSNLIDVFMNDGLTSIEESAFFQCHRLEYLRIPSSVTSIKPSAFRDCPILTTILYCNNRENVIYTDDPFPGNPTIYVFTDYSSGTFCGHDCLRVLDHACNIPTDHFSWQWKRHSWKVINTWKFQDNLHLMYFSYILRI